MLLNKRVNSYVNIYNEMCLISSTSSMLSSFYIVSSLLLLFFTPFRLNSKHGNALECLALNHLFLGQPLVVIER